MKLQELYTQIISEVRMEDVIFQHNNRAVVDTTHATERFLQRIRHIDRDMIFTAFRKMIDKFDLLEPLGKIKGEEFLVFSKSLKQAFIVAYRVDRFDRQDKTKHFYIMTYLPPGKKEAKPGTRQVMIEQHSGSFLNDLSDDFIQYVSDIVKSRNVKLDESTKEYDYFSVKLVNNFDYKIVLSENKLYTLSINII